MEKALKCFGRLLSYFLPNVGGLGVSVQADGDGGPAADAGGGAAA